jgi:phage terminase small subunit
MGAKRFNNLTQKERLFCQLYVFGGKECLGNATACYERAYGFRGQKRASLHNYANRVMKRPTVQKTIQKMSLSITPECIKAQLVAIVESATKTSDRIRALELLGKMMGMFGTKEKTEIKTLELLFQQ